MRTRIVLFAAVPAVFASALAQAPADDTAKTPRLPPGMQPGYLARDQLPDSLALLPPPPVAGTAALARDEEARRMAEPVKGSTRWVGAISDAELRFPKAAEAFSCALGLPISKERSPALYSLLQRTLLDFGLSTYAAKNHYQRTRPFAAHKGESCTPGEEAFLRKDGSYPSGHSAVGWGWALVLTGVAPDRTDAILARGRDFGQSRVVCNVHWQSDVDAGRVIASATFARLSAEPAFRENVVAAKKEVEALRLGGAKAPANCST